MIIYVDGDSFTHGMELWEEKNILGYADMTQTEYKKWIQPELPPSEGAKRELTYTKILQDKIGCKVINNGQSGASQQEIAQRILTELPKLKELYPSEDIICIMQNTGLNRLWLWRESFSKNCSHVLSVIENTVDEVLDGYEIKNIYLNYVLEEQFHSEYYLNLLAVQNYCTNADIKFIHFHMYDKLYNTYTTEFMLSYIKDLFFNECFCVQDSMYDRLRKHYGHRNFYLPGLHVNCDSHKLIGEWLIAEMKKRGIL